MRNSFDKRNMLLAKIKDFNALIDNKPHFEKPTKNKQEAYEKLVEISRNNDYTPGNVDYWYYQKYYKIIGIYLSRQTNTNISRQINFMRKLEEKRWNINAFYCRKAKKPTKKQQQQQQQPKNINQLQTN